MQWDAKKSLKLTAPYLNQKRRITKDLVQVDKRHSSGGSNTFKNENCKQLQLQSQTKQDIKDSMSAFTQ